ncbi:hypothetical protein TELCIR_17439 [Teladorsagia circumcincta]|uniref:Uncharacterized protein n=1 Tax=Teladorsagia circumcincta TaxID=45464 RepID=A0A2G9TSS1_TELCI|nr:hypothetical protein TELCIR_17439 [Teladorsagia circumcincta]
MEQRVSVTGAGMHSQDGRCVPQQYQPVGNSIVAEVEAGQNVIKARHEPMVAFMYNLLDKLIALIANKLTQMHYQAGALKHQDSW